MEPYGGWPEEVMPLVDELECVQLNVKRVQGDPDATNEERQGLIDLAARIRFELNWMLAD
jgi:hypothetical protein